MGATFSSSTAAEASRERKEEIKEAKESHLIVAALIATVTFIAAFTLPGGVIQDGDKEGTAILSKKAAFQAFVITDAIAFVLSLSAVFAHFLMSLLISKENNSGKFAFLLMCGALSTMTAMVAMVIAFVTGTYAVLTTSSSLAILTTFIGLSFFILMFLILIGLRFTKKEWFEWLAKKKKEWFAKKEWFEWFAKKKNEWFEWFAKRKRSGSEGIRIRKQIKAPSEFMVVYPQ